MEKNTEPGSMEDKKKKEEDEILELAEEVLGSSDDDIIGQQGDAVVTTDEDDEVIDLTDASEPPIADDDEILDLTEELEQTEGGDDLTIAEDDEIMELEDITDVSADTEVAILELDEAIDALAESKEEDVTGGGIVEEEPEEAVLDLRDTVEEEPMGSETAATAPAFAIETDTVELNDTDRRELEQEFGFETEDEGIPEAPTVEQEPIEGGFLADTLDQELDETVEMTEPAAAAAETPPAPLAEPPDEPLELTDEDRATLEEELGGGGIEELSVDVDSAPEPLPMEEDAQDDFLDQAPQPAEELSVPLSMETSEDEIRLDEIDQPLEQPEAPEPEIQAAEESEIRFDAEELSMSEEADEEPAVFEMGAEEEPAESAGDELQQSMELADVDGEELQAEIEGSGAEPPGFDLPSDDEPQAVSEEITGLGLDGEEPPAEETDASLAAAELGLTDEPSVGGVQPLDADPQEFSIGSDADATDDETPLTAEGLTAAAGEPAEEIGVPDETPSEISFDSQPEEPAPIDTIDEDANGLSVAFDQTEPFEQTDLHKDADPISIRVKEPATEDHSDEDELLNKVFESRSEDATPPDLEQTVERVVSETLASKIEVLLAEAIEKAVEKEIGRLKQLLMDDLNRLE